MALSLKASNGSRVFVGNAERDLFASHGSNVVACNNNRNISSSGRESSPGAINQESAYCVMGGNLQGLMNKTNDREIYLRPNYSENVMLNVRGLAGSTGGEMKNSVLSATSTAHGMESAARTLQGPHYGDGAGYMTGLNYNPSVRPSMASESYELSPSQSDVFYASQQVRQNYHAPRENYSRCGQVYEGFNLDDSYAGQAGIATAQREALYRESRPSAVSVYKSAENAYMQ